MIPTRLTKRTVLCIDRDRAFCYYEKALLERSGYSVLTTASVQQGLNLVTTCECDAVLVDYEMPAMDGSELAAETKRVRPDLVVILLSSSDVLTHASAQDSQPKPKGLQYHDRPWPS